jgi:hypothetical protein
MPVGVGFAEPGGEIEHGFGAAAGRQQDRRLAEEARALAGIAAPQHDNLAPAREQRLVLVDAGPQARRPARPARWRASLVVACRMRRTSATAISAKAPAPSAMAIGRGAHDVLAVVPDWARAGDALNRAMTRLADRCRESPSVPDPIRRHALPLTDYSRSSPPDPDGELTGLADAPSPSDSPRDRTGQKPVTAESPDITGRGIRAKRV